MNISFSPTLKPLVTLCPFLNSLEEHKGPFSTTSWLCLLSILKSLLQLNQVCLLSHLWSSCPPFLALAHSHLPPGIPVSLPTWGMPENPPRFTFPVWISRCPPSDASLFCPQFAHNLLISQDLGWKGILKKFK